MVDANTVSVFLQAKVIDGTKIESSPLRQESSCGTETAALSIDSNWCRHFINPTIFLDDLLFATHFERISKLRTDCILLSYINV